MTLFRRSFAVLCSLSSLVAACGKSSPAAPTGFDTRAIEITGNLDFNEVEVGEASQRTIRIANPGTALVTVTGISASNGGDAFTANWNSGAIGAGSTQVVTVVFRPIQRRVYSGLLMVASDANQGSARHPISAQGLITRPLSQFGDGVWLVNTEITPGRYFADPNGECGWERTRQQTHFDDEDVRLGGDHWVEDVGQVIAEIHPGDFAFASSIECGAWSLTSQRAPAATVAAGVGRWWPGCTGNLSRQRFHRLFVEAITRFLRHA